MAKIIDTFRDLPHKLHLSGGAKIKANDKQLRQFKEFFDIKPVCKFGYPECVTATAHDPALNILAVGTKAGEIFVFGAPGVEFYSKHPAENSEIVKLAFLANQGRLLSLTSDNRLHKWELNAPTTGQDVAEQQWRLEHVTSLEAGPADGADGQLVTSVAVVTGDAIWLGYENGRVRVVDGKAWKFTEFETSAELISASLSDELKSSVTTWGPVVAIELEPSTTSVQQASTNGDSVAEDATHQQEVKEPLVAVGFRGGAVALVGSSDAKPKCLAPTSTSASTDAAELSCLTWRPAEASSEKKPTLLTGFSDGAYSEWQIPGELKEEPVAAIQLGDRQTVYGPFPCQPISLLAASAAGAVAFAGGLAKNTHSETHSVTLIAGGQQACYELSAEPVGLVMPQPDCLLAISQTRLLAIDIADAKWRPIRAPYLRSLAAADSQVTVARVFGPLSELPEAARSALESAANASKADSTDRFSGRDWPVTGGRLFGSGAEDNSADLNSGRYLLVTGHSDGGVAFWMLDGCRGLGTPFGRLDTASLFIANHGNGVETADSGDAFPKLLRNVGVDFPPPPPLDPRLAVFDIQLVGEDLLVTGAGGQAIAWSPSAEPDPVDVRVDMRTVKADFLAEGSAAADAYEWTGPEPLQIRPPEAAVQFGAPFRPSFVALVSPPAPLSSATYSQRCGLLAIGSPFGVALFDTVALRLVKAHSTLPVTAVDHDAAAATANGDSASSGGIGSSLRQSFRMLKKLRPGRKQEYAVNAEKKPEKKAAVDKKEEQPSEEKPPLEEDAAETAKKTEAADEPAVAAAAPEAAEAAAPAEPEAAAAAEAIVEAATVSAPPQAEKRKLNPLDPRPRGQIGALLLAETHLVSPAARVVSLWAGDASGRILAFQLTRPAAAAPKPEAGADASAAKADEEKESGDTAAEKPASPAEGDWQAQLVKELHLKHGAPVSALYALSARNHSLVNAEAATDGPHELLVASEEQVKLFSLPGLKPRVKARLTGRLLASGHAAFPSSSRANSSELGLVACLDNGTLLVLGFPGLKAHAWQEHALPQPSGDVAVCCQAGSCPVVLAVEAGGQLGSVHRLSAANLGLAFQRNAGLDLPEGARKKAEEEPALTTAAAETAAVVEEPPAANAAVTNGEEKIADKAKGDEKDDEDQSAKPVAADITMDDIKEYATGTAPGVIASEPIPELAGEDKRDSALSDVGEAAKEDLAKVTPAAEVN